MSIPRLVVPALAPQLATSHSYSICALYDGGLIGALGGAYDYAANQRVAARAFFWIACDEAHAGDPESDPPHGEAPTFAAAVFAASAALAPDAVFSGEHVACAWLSGRDPLVQLTDALAAHGKPSMRWLVRWSQDGAEPFAAAWHASENPSLMLSYTWHRPGGGRCLARLRASGVTIMLGERIEMQTSEHRTSELVELLRATPPTLPTLAEVIAEHAAGCGALANGHSAPWVSALAEVDGSVGEYAEAAAAMAALRCGVASLEPFASTRAGARCVDLRAAVERASAMLTPACRDALLEVASAAQDLRALAPGGSVADCGAAYRRLVAALSTLEPESYGGGIRCA